MSLADEILGGSSSKQTNKSNNKNNNKNNSNKKKNNQTKISDEIFSGNYSAPKQTTTVQQKQSTPKQTVKLTGNKFLDNAIKNANNTERNEATKQQIQALANRWNSNLDKKTLLQQVGNYVTSGDALDDATNLAKKGAMFATNKNYRNQVIKKGLNSAAVAIPQLAKGVIKTGENWYDTLQTADFLVNEGAARKLGITSEEDYQKKKQKLENKVKDDWTGNLWKYGFGWDEDVDKFLGQNSYITGSNTAGQLVESVGQQLPAMAIGQAGMDYMLGGNAANSAFQSLKGLRGVERAKAVGTNLTRAAAINSASNAEIFARSYGAATEEALQQGASLEQASKYGVLNALTEIGTEWITSGIPGVEESTGLLSNGASKLLDKTTGKIKKEPLRRIVRNILDFTGGMAGEGFEEALSEIISPYIKNATYTQGEKVNLNDVISSFLMGAASAGLLDFGGNVANRLTGRKANIQNNELAQQQVNQIEQQVQNREITPQEGTQQIEDIQNYLQAQEAQTEQTQEQPITPQETTQTVPTVNKTAQDNTNTQEQQNVPQNANDEVNQKAEKTFKNIKTKEDMDKLISNLKDKVENIKTGEDLKNTFKEIYDIYKVYNKSNDIYEVVEKDGLYGTKFESEFYNPDIKYKPLNEEIKIQKENLDNWLSYMQNDVDKIVYDNQDKVTPTIGKNINSLDEVTPITTDNFQNEIKDYINKETEGIKGKFESKDGHLYRGGKEIKYLYRAINQAEMDSIKNSGYIKSNQSKNIGYEIEQGLTDFKDGYPGFYLPRNADGYIIKIEVKPENGFFYDSDEYAKTPNQIPASQIVEINGEKINNLQQNQIGVKNNNIEKTTQQEYNKVTKEEGVENEFRKLQEESRRMSSEDTESFHSGQRQIDEGIRNRLSRVLGGRLQAGDGSLWNGNSSIVNKKTGKNIEILENVDPQTFKETFEIVQKYLPNGDAVDVHDVKSSEYSTGYEDTKNFLSKDGLSGFAITKDGDLISVFNLGEKGYLKSIKDYVKKNGAKTLDCYQSERQPLADMYNKTLGFKTASLMDFNYDILVEDKGKEYADYFVKTYGEAPVAFMVDTDQDIETKHFNKDQYDEALEYRNSLVDKEGTSDSSFSNETTNIPETKNEQSIKIELTGVPKNQVKTENTGISIGNKPVQIEVPINSSQNKLGQYVPKDGFTKKELKNGKIGDSKFYKNVTERADFISDEVRKQAQSDDYIKHHRKITNDESMQMAFDDLNTRGTEAIADFFNNDKELTSKDTAMGWLLIEQSQANGDYNFSNQVLRKMRSSATKTGQAMQMYNYYARLTPEGMYRWCGDQLLRAEEIFEKNKTKKWIEANKNRWQLNGEEVEFIKDQMEKIQKLNKMNDSDTTTIDIKGKPKKVTVDRAKQVEIAKIQAMIEDKIPHQKGQALNAWMRISMLGNLKTIGTRNPLGNIALRPVNDVGDFVSSLVDYAISKKTGVRTKGNLNIKAQAKGFKKGSSEAVQDFKLGIDTKNQKGNRFEIGQGKSFNEKHVGATKVLNPLSKVGNKADTGVSFLLDLGDRPFYEAAYTQSLENQMKLNGIEKVEDASEWMKKIAEQEALERTYQDDNNYTTAVVDIRKAMNKFNVKGYGLGDVIIPFAKTPANLTKAIVDYSPAGFVSALTKGNELRTAINNEQFTPEMQHRFVNQLGKATAGTILYVIGAALANSGLITGGADEDKDVADFMRNTLGIQPYSIKIGNKSFTYDWAQPVASAFAIPADIKKGIQDAKNQEVDLQYIIHKSFSTAGNILLEQSFLQGIKEVLGGYGDPLDNLMSEIEGLPARAVPTLFQQIVTYLDPTKRMSYGNKGIQNVISQAIAKTPFAKNLPVYRNTMGKEVKMYGGKNNFFNVFINPSNYSEGNATKSAEEIYAIYQATNDKTILPRTVGNDLKNEDGTKLTNQQKSDFLKISGDFIDENVEKLTESNEYKNMSNEDKAATIKYIVDYAYNKARKEITGHKLSSEHQKTENAEKSGYPMADYFISKKVNKTKTSKSTTSRNRYEELQQKGIDGRTFDDFVSFVKKTKGDSKKGGLSKKEKVINYIQGLNHLTAKEKQALYEDYQQNSRTYSSYN